MALAHYNYKNKGDGGSNNRMVPRGPTILRQ